MFELDMRNRKPIYEQLPSVRTLAQQLTINPNTIQKAYRELEIQGFIYSVKGKGSFVNPTNQTRDLEKITVVKKELEKLILEALYLGVSALELIELIREIDSLKGGGDSHD